MVGSQAVATLASLLESEADGIWADPYLAPTPDEVATTVRETIPNIVRLMWVRPVRESPNIAVDAYAGPDYVSSGPDIFVLPGGERAVCHMIPGVIVFLADGATFHYAKVSEVNYERGTITFADPWSSVSFLRKGFNQAGVAGELVATVGGRPGLRLSFKDFAAVFRGEIDMTAELAGVAPSVTFDALARIYPEIAATEQFQFWRDSRLLSGIDHRHGLDGVVDLMNRNDLDAKPSLALLANVASVMLTVRSNFGTVHNILIPRIVAVEDAPDSPERRKFIADARQQVLAYIPTIAGALPTVVMLRMIEDAAATDDLELRLHLADSFQSKHPDDLDLLIAKAEALLRLERYGEARQLVDLGRRQWSEAIEAVIDLPADRALAWFDEWSPKLYLVTFNLLHWQRVRLALFGAIADPMSIDGKTSDWLERLGKSYATDQSYGVSNDFLSEALWLAWRRGDTALERELIADGMTIGIFFKPGDEGWRRHMAAAVLDHARWRHGLRDLLGGDWEATRTSFLKPEMCRLIDVGPKFSLRTEPGYLARRAELDAFCQ
jgi:hypothetical protein